MPVLNKKEDKKEMVVKKDDLDYTIEFWNSIVEHLIAAKKDWEKLQEVFSAQTSLNRLNYNGNKKLSVINPKSKFDVFLPRFVDSWRRMGGIEEFIITEKDKGDN